MIRYATLHDACELLTDGTHYTPPDLGNGIAFLTVKDLTPHGLDFENCSKISEAEYLIAKKQNSAPCKGDVLFSKDGTVGKVHLVVENREFAVLSSLAILRPKQKLLDAGFLAHFLRSPEAVGAAGQRKTGSAIRRIVLRDLGNLMVPLPPLDEQRRIAAILDRVDEMRRACRKASALSEDLWEALFRQHFICRDAQDWPVVTIDEIAQNLRTGPFGSQLLHSEFVDEGIAVLGIDNAVRNEFAWEERRYITERKYKSLSRYTVRPGDLIITIMGTCGRCAIIPDDIPLAINTKHLCCMTLDQSRALATFIHATLLLNPEVLRQLGVQAKGAVMPGLNMGIIESLKLRLPPIQLQWTFAAEVRELKALADSRRAQLAKLDYLFASLQHRAFNGELTRSDERLLEPA